MPKKFEFENSLLQLDICGEIYEVDIYRPDFQEGLAVVVEKANGIKTENPSESEVKQIMKLCVESIDKILGDGAVFRIFADRIVNFPDLIDLMCYIQQELMEYRELRESKYASRL